MIIFNPTNGTKVKKHLNLVQKKYIILFLSILLSINIHTQNKQDIDSVLFRFKFKENDSYKIHSTVHERVFVNGIFHHDAEIINRIVVKTSDVRTINDTKSALFSCTFMTSEKNSNKTFDWERTYPSIFRRDELGIYTIEDKYFMPVVRDVPIFPKTPLKPMEIWEGNGTEAHDFRDVFNIEKPFFVPFKVRYQYMGPAEIEGKVYRRIEAKYNLDYIVPDKILKTYAGNIDVPVKTLGISKQNLYWDEEKGNLYCYDEEFKIKLILYSGQVLDFEGTANAKIIEIEETPKDTEKKLKEDIKALKLDNTTIKKTNEGLTISIENIQFMPDSAILENSEKEKLIKIAEILKPFSDNEFLITGYTARAGSYEEREILSKERAEAVANFLLECGVLKREYVYTRGLGAKNPIVPNNSEKNKARNRRVEITILDK